MKDKLLFSGPQKQRRFALSGVGGAGKTQIALEYTYLHLEDYRAIIWILADSPEKISQGFEDAAEMMGMPRGTQGTNQTKAFVLQRLATTSESLLILFYILPSPGGYGIFWPRELIIPFVSRR